ncbi:hypothetical protein [Streptomyces olivochromogenes]|uniref:hypothetical protein n=1 Tax=Streptomyces olivochromogenes TaxID=1963 RepID=UPI0036A921E6
MKPTLVLLVPGSEHREFMAEIRALGVVHRPDPQFDFLELEGENYQFSFSGCVIEDFSPEGLEEASQVAPDPFAIPMEYEDAESAKVLARRMDSEPEWDWRFGE